MKEKKREEMPDILNDILGNRKPEQAKTKPDKNEDKSHNVKPSQQQDVMTSLSHNGEKIDTEQELTVDKVTDKSTNVITLDSHDSMLLQSHDVIPSKTKIVKTTLYLSQELFEQLDEVWLKLRKKGYSKNDIVEIAIKQTLDKFSNDSQYI